MQLGVRGQAAAPLRRTAPVGSGRALLLRTATGGARAAAAPPRLACPAPAASSIAVAALYQRLRVVAAAQAADGGSGGGGSGGQQQPRSSKQQEGSSKAQLQGGGKAPPPGSSKAPAPGSGKAPAPGGGKAPAPGSRSKGVSSSGSSSSQQAKRPPPGAGSKGPSPARLTSLIKAADSLEELEQLEAQHGGSFNFIHISTVFSKAGHIVSDSAGRLQPTAAHPLLRRLARRLEPQLGDCGEQAAANIVWACGKLQFAERAPLLNGCVERLLESPDATPQGLSNALYGAALLQEHGYSIHDQQAERLLQGIAERHARLNAYDVSNTLWAAAKLYSCTPPPRVAGALLAMTEGVKQGQVAAVPQDVANSLWALATLCLGPQPLTQWLAGGALQQLPRMNPQDISNTALALAKLGLHAPQLFGPLAAAAERQGAALCNNAQAVCNRAWAVAVADQRPLAAAVVALLRPLAADTKLWASTVSQDHWQLHQVHMWLFDSGSAGGLAGALSPPQLAQCAAAWDANLTASAAQRRNDFERRVYAAACRLPSLADCRQEVRTPDGAFNVDVVAKHIASGLALAIEADGPTHFVLPGRSATGETLARNRALAARGYVVVGLPWWQWRDLNNNAEAEDAWLQSRVEAAVKAALAARGGNGQSCTAAAAAA